MTAPSTPTRIRPQGLLALFFVGALIVVATWMVSEAYGRDGSAPFMGDDPAADAQVTVRVPGETLRSTSVTAVAGDLIRVEFPLQPDAPTELRVSAPSWLNDLDDDVQIVPADGSAIRPQPRVPVLTGSTVNSPTDAHLRIDYVIDEDIEPGTDGTVEVQVGDRSIEATVSVDSEPLTPVVQAGSDLLGPSDLNMVAWDSEDDPIARSVNRWFNVPEDIGGISNYRQFLRVRDADAPETMRWTTGTYAYPGDRLHLSVFVSVSTSRETISAEDARELAAEEPDSPRLVRDLHVSAATTRTAASEHHVTGRIETPDQPTMTATVVVRSDVDIRLRPIGNAFWSTEGEYSRPLFVELPEFPRRGTGLLFGVNVDDVIYQGPSFFVAIQEVVVAAPDAGDEILED